MRAELRRYSSIGNEPGILLLCEKIFTGNVEDVSSIKTACSFINGVEINVKCGLMALEDLHLIQLKGNECKTTELVYNRNRKNKFIIELCTHCLKVLVNEDLIDRDQIKYDEGTDLFYIPRFAFKIECSVYRNMLITFSAMGAKGPQFVVSSNYEPLFTNIVNAKRKTTTQEELLKQLEHERIMGEEGEQFVLSYERNRCPFPQSKLNKIKQISLVDVSAGYDIISFENEISNDRRYIEVKTYEGKPHFNWSANEVNSSKLRQDSYYIYLVDYSKIKMPGYQPYIIQNPYKEVKDNDKWKMTPSSYLVEPTFDLKDVHIGANNNFKLLDVRYDRDVIVLVNNWITLYPTSEPIKLVSECQRLFGEKYHGMRNKEWLKVVQRYVKELIYEDRPEDETIKGKVKLENLKRLLVANAC